MANSADVTANVDTATAAQYNNLRTDVLDNTSGHVHDGTDGRDLLQPARLDFAAATELTIDASGDITVTQSYHRIDTASDDASDNLDGISGGAAGWVLVLRPENDARTVVVRHNQNAAATKNILLADGLAFTMDAIRDHLTLIYDATLDTNGAWVELGRSEVHTKYTDAEAITAVEGEATLVLAGDVTIDGAKSLLVDVINEKDSGAGVTIDGLQIKDGIAVGLDYGLAFKATVTTYTDITHFKATNLIGLGNDFFTDYYVYVLWDAGGASAAPQKECQPISDFVSSDGTVTHTAFTSPLATTDVVMMVHKAIAFLLGVAGPQPPTAKSIFDILHKDGSYTFDNTTDSLEALRDYIAALETKIDTIDDFLDTEVAAILTDTGTTLDALLKQKGGRITLASDIQATVVVNATAGNKSLPSIVVTAGTIPPNATITRALAGISWRKQVDSSGSANAINVAQDIDVDITGGFVTAAINMIDNSLATAASATEGGTFILGDNDIKAEVADGSTTTFQWTSADVDGASLTFHDVQMWLIVEYE